MQENNTVYYDNLSVSSSPHLVTSLDTTKTMLYVLLAMGYSRRRASSCIRVSLSRHNTPEEIDAFLSALKEITKQYGKV